MIRHLVAGALALWAVLGASGARAEWRAATSRHFIIYADTSEAALRAQAVALERMDWSLRHFLRLEDSKTAASNPLTIYVTSDAAIHALCRCTSAAGFYQARVSGSVAFTSRDSGLSDNAAEGARIVLFHEYAHHFMYGAYALAFPAWFSEGFAEFASTIRITDKDVTIGRAAQHRAAGLLLGKQFRAQEMLDPKFIAQVRGGAAMDAFYGRGWLLTHFFLFRPERFKQFDAYLHGINRGQPGLEAARAAFGDLAKLDKEVADYLAASRLPAMTVTPESMPAPEIALRRLSAGEAAMIRLRMDSTHGVSAKTAAPLYQRAAPVAARFPDDAVAQGWLAEMAYDAGEMDAARAAADRALARDPKSVQALLYKSRVALAAAATANATDPAVWNEARRPILVANRLDPDDAEPLWLFYTSFALQGAPPRPSALTGLYRAQELVPEDEDVRFAAAIERIRAGETDAAKRLIRPIAYDPHAAPDNPAARMLAALDAGKPKEDVLAAGERRDKPAE